MQANSNAITSAPSPPATEAGRWRCAFAGAWSAEWSGRRRDRRTWTVVGLGLALALAAALLTAMALRGTLDARAVAQSSELDRWLNQGRKYPHAAAHHGVYVFKPLSPLAALDPGVERYVGASVWLEAHKQNDFVQRAVTDTPGAARQFSLTPAFVLQVLAPLAIVFLGFGAFSGERERGQLAVLRLSGAPLGALAAARAAVLLCLALAMALPACVAVAAVKWNLDARNPFVDAGLRSTVFVLGHVLYLATWCALTVGVSALMPSLRNSLALLVGLWAATALVLPRVAMELAQSVAPLPSAQQFRERLDADLNDPLDALDEVRTKARLLEQHGVDDVSRLPVNWAGINLQRGEDHGNAVFDRHHGRLIETLAAQDRAVAWAGWLSPTVAVSGLSGAAAASDSAHHVQFAVAAEAQRRAIQKVLNDAIAAHPERQGRRVDGDLALWKKIPPFEFNFDPLARSGLWLRHAATLLSGLAASLLVGAVALRRLRRGALR